MPDIRVCWQEEIEAMGGDAAAVLAPTKQPVSWRGLRITPSEVQPPFPDQRESFRKRVQARHPVLHNR